MKVLRSHNGKSEWVLTILMMIILSYRMLDLILSNTDLQISTCDEPLIPEDFHHKSLDIRIDIIFHIFCISCIYAEIKICFETSNYDELRQYLNSINWDERLQWYSLDEALNNFYNTLNVSIDKYIPHKLTTATHFWPWYNTSLKKVLKEKFKYLLKDSKYGNTADYDTFSLIRPRAKLLETDCYAAYIKNCGDSIVKNPNYFGIFSMLTSNTLISSSHSCRIKMRQLAPGKVFVPDLWYTSNLRFFQPLPPRLSILIILYYMLISITPVAIKKSIPM